MAKKHHTPPQAPVKPEPAQPPAPGPGATTEAQNGGLPGTPEALSVAEPVPAPQLTFNLSGFYHDPALKLKIVCKRAVPAQGGKELPPPKVACGGELLIGFHELFTTPSRRPVKCPKCNQEFSEGRRAHIEADQAAVAAHAFRLLAGAPNFEVHLVCNPAAVTEMEKA